MNRKKILLIAAVMLIIGVILIAIGISGMKGDLTGLDTRKITERTVLLTEDFDAVSVKDSTADVNFLVSADDKALVVLTEEEDYPHSVTVKNGTLIIEQYKDPLPSLTIQLKKTGVTVYLPKKAYRQLDSSLTTGECRLAIPVRFDTVNASASTGDIILKADIGSVDAVTTTGGIRVNDMACDSVRISSSTGDIGLGGLRVSRGISCTASTGNVTLKECTAGNIFVKTSTGDITLNDCDAGELELSATTGDIRGSLLTGKHFRTHSATGEINCPADSGDGDCSVTTSTGDISITVREQ